MTLKVLKTLKVYTAKTDPDHIGFVAGSIGAKKRKREHSNIILAVTLFR